MDHRERVLTAINHEEPDFIPTALWGSAYGVTDELYFQLIKLLQLDSPVLPFRRNKHHTINYYDERILDALDIDVRYVDCGFTDLGGPTLGGGRDAWGIRYEQNGLYLSAVEHPLATGTVEDVDSYTFPTVWKYMQLEEFSSQAKFLKEQTNFAVVGRAFDSHGVFARCCALRKTENFLNDLAYEEELPTVLIQKVTDTLCKLLEIYLTEVGNYLDIIELPGDDYASSRPFISPRTFDRFFYSSYKRMIDMIHQAAPGCKVLFHSDGNMEPFLSRFISLGVDVFHGLEPIPGMDMDRIKEEYGNQISFMGAIDIRDALRGSEQQVADEVKLRIQQLGKDGGYILAPANHLEPDIPAGKCNCTISICQRVREAFIINPGDISLRAPAGAFFI